MIRSFKTEISEVPEGRNGGNVCLLYFFFLLDRPLMLTIECVFVKNSNRTDEKVIRYYLQTHLNLV